MWWLLVLSVFMLSACGTPLQPRIGMPYDQFKKQVTLGTAWGGAGCSGVEMIVAEGDMTAYRVKSEGGNCPRGVFYYFQNDKLVRIDQGELYQQRYKIDINR
jgi:hypothetical protein